MKRLLLRRAISLPLVLLGMTLVTFAITHIVPGDPARLEAGPHATEAQVKVLRHQYGYDQPLVKQYVTYMGTSYMAISATPSRHGVRSPRICASSSQPRLN